MFCMFIVWNAVILCVALTFKQYCISVKTCLCTENNALVCV